jgi:hypothetical protein
VVFLWVCVDAWSNQGNIVEFYSGTGIRLQHGWHAREWRTWEDFATLLAIRYISHWYQSLLLVSSSKQLEVERFVNPLVRGSTSEAVLGKAFLKIAEEFPRSSYQIITKAGRYGRTKETGFDYSPERIRSSIANSLKLLNTTYLDGVYMHDVEFVGSQIGGAGEEGFTVDEEGNIRSEDLERWGLGKGMDGEIRSEGDQKVLDAMSTLFDMKKEGTIHAVGFSGKSAWSFFL